MPEIGVSQSHLQAQRLFSFLFLETFLLCSPSTHPMTNTQFLSLHLKGSIRIYSKAQKMEDRVGGITVVRFLFSFFLIVRLHGWVGAPAVTQKPIYR